MLLIQFHEGNDIHITADSPVQCWVQKAVNLLILQWNSSQHEVKDVEVLLSLVLVDHARFLQKVLIDFGSFDYKHTKNSGYCSIDSKDLWVKTHAQWELPGLWWCIRVLSLLSFINKPEEVWKRSWMYFPKRLLLSFMTVWAFPKASRSGFTYFNTIRHIHVRMKLRSPCTFSPIDFHSY